jgi:hypothetical protein
MKSVYPRKGMECMEDVEKLLIRGEDTLALGCYRKINPKLSLKVASENILMIKAQIKNKTKHN